jgi:hypothetical protein
MSIGILVRSSDVLFNFKSVGKYYIPLLIYNSDELVTLRGKIQKFSLTSFCKRRSVTGQDLVPKFRAGEPWKKVFGPVFIYHNYAPIGDYPFWLWEDARIQMMNEV